MGSLLRKRIGKRSQSQCARNSRISQEIVEGNRRLRGAMRAVSDREASHRTNETAQPKRNRAPAPPAAPPGREQGRSTAKEMLETAWERLRSPAGCAGNRRRDHPNRWSTDRGRGARRTSGPRADRSKSPAAPGRTPTPEVRQVRGSYPCVSLPFTRARVKRRAPIPQAERAREPAGPPRGSRTRFGAWRHRAAGLEKKRSQRSAMSKRRLGVFGCMLVMAGAAWIGSAGLGEKKADAGWTLVTPGIARSPGRPAGYALLDGDHALLIDAPQDAKGLERHGVKQIDLVLLTHYHRDSCAAAAALLRQRVAVRAPKDAAEWLTPAGVRKYWHESLPLRNSRTAYLVLPVGLDGIDCSLQDDQKIAWRGWNIHVVATPGHARAHVAIAARKGSDGPLAIFCGGALAGAGKMWAPYTTDWDHWTDAGLAPAAKSLRKLASLKPALVLRAHGPAITKDAPSVLAKTAAAIDEVGFLKSYERYTKQRLGDAPQYRFLAKEQAGSNGSLPWSRVSEHLFYTGNTWVLT